MKKALMISCLWTLDMIHRFSGDLAWRFLVLNSLSPDKKNEKKKKKTQKNHAINDGWVSCIFAISTDEG